MRKYQGKLSGDLGSMSQMMILGPGLWSAAIRETIFSADYEKYTTPDSRQTFLPGCCHLGCTDFSGPSDAALETLLHSM